MRQTTEYRSYKGCRVDTSFHAPVCASSLSQRRRGFTLVEMVVAVAVLLILLLALVGSYATSVSEFKHAQLMTLAENIVELQVEDLKSMAPSVLRALVQGQYTGTETQMTPPEENSALYRFSNYPPDTDASDVRYDSSAVQTDYNIWGLMSLQTASGTFTAGPGTTSQPPTPSAGDILLGNNVAIEPYQVLDSSTGQNVGWYYRLILHKEQYPQFEKRIQVSMFSASGSPQVNNNSDAMFDYTVTVSMRSGASFDTLYSVSGTISYPYSGGSIVLSVLQPNGGESLLLIRIYSVIWSVNGDTTNVTEYRVYCSTDNGDNWTLLGTAGTGQTSLSVALPGVASTECLMQVVAVYSSGLAAGSDATNAVFTIH